MDSDQLLIRRAIDGDERSWSQRFERLDEVLEELKQQEDEQ
jgi:hypothetical protein